MLRQAQPRAHRGETRVLDIASPPWAGTHLPETRIDASTAAQSRAGWQSGEPRVALVTDDLPDAVAVAGDEDTCRAGLRRLAAAGLDTAVLTDDMSRAELAAAVTAVRTV